jgi:hypothetical protein
VISVDDHFPFHNVMLPLSTSLHDKVHILVISGIPANNIRECLAMIGHLMSMPSEDCNDSMARGICLIIKWLLQVYQSEDGFHVEVVF